MIYFSCDYHYGAHPRILERLATYNTEANVGYSMDEHTAKAKALIKSKIGREDVDVHILVGGTQTSTTVIAAALKPYQGVLTADSGHINQHETGAIEATGHKVIGLPGVNGKLTAEQVHEFYLAHKNNSAYEHIVMPKMVYISNPTEVGSIYSKAELTALAKICKEDGLYLFMDGARLGYGLTSPENDLDLETIADCCDVFYIGGTKCGAMFGEAVIITNDVLKEDFRFMIKQHGGMLAKGWLLGIQYEALFEDNLYFDICKHANDQAMRIKKAFSDQGILFKVDSPTNQQFVMLTDEQAMKFADKYVVEDEERALHTSPRAVRFCTSWATKTEEVDMLIEDIKRWC